MMKYVLFESLVWLAVGWVVIQVCLIAVWSSLRSRLSARIVWGGFVTGPVLLVISQVVETDREYAIQVVRNLAQSVADENLPAFRFLLADDFRVNAGRGIEWDKEDMIEFADRCFERYAVYYPELHGFEVDIDDSGTCRCEFGVNCQVELPEFGARWLPTRWVVYMVERDARWQIRRVEPIPVPPLRIQSLVRLER